MLIHSLRLCQTHENVKILMKILICLEKFNPIIITIFLMLTLINDH